MKTNKLIPLVILALAFIYLNNLQEFLFSEKNEELKIESSSATDFLEIEEIYWESDTGLKSGGSANYSLKCLYHKVYRPSKRILTVAMDIIGRNNR